MALHHHTPKKRKAIKAKRMKGKRSKKKKKG